jgi:hypothetical protein
MTAERFARINAGQFRELFIEDLGWNKPDHPPIQIDVDGTSHQLTQVAGYKGVRVWSCPEVPDRRSQRLIDHAVKKVSNERLLIFHDKVHQEWRWPQSSDTQGKSQPRLVTHQHYVGKPNPALDQRLGMISLGITEDLTVVALLQRMRRAFDADKVTNAFYKQFLVQHQALVKALKGIDNKGDREWYSALLMNRLMFIYFMQRKGFMDNDPNYLRTRLDRLQELAGKGHFYEFYRDLLVPLFHDGLGAPGKKIDSKVIHSLVGDVPYINGGIFAVHPIEAHNEISVGDDTFRKIFDLFDAYQWHLDDRPSANPNEINPDVLGYIFEQFINQKEQGAYYTHEDVTHFMTASTLVPVFLERLQQQTQINPWQRLQTEPGRYIWESLAFGLDQPVPDAVTAESNDTARPTWCEKAPPTHGLPGETWWELERRRTVRENLLARIAAGEINDVNEAVSANLDLESLAVDLIDGMDSPEDVAAAWRILSELKVIDPTCGSGAFLFAALKIFQNLYGTVLDAAHAHARTAKHAGLDAILAAVRKHPNHEYFILKHATLSNLYGVDLMHEAVEIARLRLFLKLVACIEKRSDLEPLPDLDFNIKAGNVLVGALDPSDIEKQSDDLFASTEVEKVVAAASGIKDEYRAFRSAQEANDEDAVAAHRASLTQLLDEVRATVDAHYFTVQGIGGSRDVWRTTHQPFHWFVEYPEVMIEGGFDVVIGNPPYVAKTKVKGYSYKGFKTNALPDIYAPCTERSGQIAREDGRFSLIVPISAQFGEDFRILRDHLNARFSNLWVSAFSRNPAALFSAGLGVRSTIIVGAGGSPGGLRTTKTHRWYDEYRPALFETLEYISLDGASRAKGWVRPTSHAIVDLFNRLLTTPGSIASAIRPAGKATVGHKMTNLYWLSVFLEDPASYDLDCSPTAQTQIGRLRFGTDREALIALAVMASKFAFVWWYSTGDDFHTTGDGLKSTPINPLALSADAQEALARAAQELIDDFPDHVQFTKYAGKWMGNFVHSEMRDITDKIDAALAADLGYEDLLPALEHAYHCVYKPTGDRPGTLRYDPCKGAG